MYMPEHFSEQRIDILHALIQSYPLATLVTQDEDGLNANHIPFLISPPTAAAPFGLLRGHVARNNPVWRGATSGREALLVFQGEQAYISPRWYEEKKRSGEVVPTYNYAVVHAHGSLQLVEDETRFLALLTDLSNHFERTMPQPWKVSDAPADFISRIMELIVGIEIPIQRITGKWKTSQNKTTQDRMNIANGLREQSTSNTVAMASVMENQLFTG